MAMRVYGLLDDLMAGAGGLVSSEGEMVIGEDVSQGDEIVLFVPGTDVSLLSAVLPARSEAEIKRAAPYAVEDDLAVPVEDLHFSVEAAASDRQAPRMIHAVAIDKMQNWSDWLISRPAFRRAQLVAEQSVIRSESIYKVEDQYIGNISGRTFVLDMGFPEDMLRTVLQGRQAETVSRTDYLRRLASHAEQAGALIDLRQGQFRAGSTANAMGLRQWRLSAGLAVALGAVLCASTLLETSALRADLSKVEASIAKSFQTAFPDASPPTNYVRAVARAVSEQGGGQQITFREASAALYLALQGVPDAQLLSLRYTQEDGELVAKIAYAAYGNDAALKATLVELGLEANLGDARQERAGVVGDIIIRRGIT